MRKNCLLLFFSCCVFLFSTSCFFRTKDISDIEGIVARPAWPIDSLQDAINFQEYIFVTKIEDYNKVEDEHYGFTGGLSRVYQWMDSLQKISSDSDLVELMKHENTVV